MARATSGLGQFRGKVGSVVFRVSQGQQIASAYQPAVRNPKSNTQTAQRNKMYLASQLSKLVPREDIIGLMPNGSARDRRSMFIQNIIENTTSKLDGELFTSQVSYKDVMFSKGNGIIFSVSGANEGGNPQPGAEKMRILFSDELTENAYNRIAIKAITFAYSEGNIRGYESRWLDMPKYNELENNSFVVDGLGRYNYMTYLIPVMLRDNFRYSRERKTLVQIVEDGEFAIAGEYSINNAVLSWGASVGYTLGNFDEIKPPTGNEDEVVNPDGPNFPNIG